MKHKIIMALFLGFAIAANAQFKNDNVLYKTVDPGDLCAALAKNPGYLLLDVRSAGENCDTSRSVSLNIGRLKGAKNIDVGELGKRIPEITDYKDKPVFVYCSHSQRSRRASKMLADSGFTKVFNINGGMTALYYDQAGDKTCLPSMVLTNNKYKVISPAEICSRMNAKGNQVFLLDVRSDSAFRHISNDAKINSIGTLEGAINIPYAELEGKLSSVPKNKEIIILDVYGTDPARAAAFLAGKGYNNLSVLIEGMDLWASSDVNELPCKNSIYKSPVSYPVLAASEFGRLVQKDNDYILLDVRTADEFGNKHKDYWRNIGRLKNAVNIPNSELNDRANELEQYKHKTIITYGFSGGPEAYAAAITLYNKGFTKVKVLGDGLFNIRWTAYNRKDQAYLKDLVTDLPEINW
ncbi:MAG TPA: rhodanese-like domain-containing protein [Chitinophagaceae bacterium]|nr:rhodanese-like domain-containing protein [Chitinophagaceae bacterium]